MGGKALKIYGINTVRLNTSDFLILSSEISKRVEGIFDTDVHIVKSYRDKLDHGDLDLLIKNTGKLGNIKEKIQKEFNPKAINSNGNCYSFDYNNFQIDFIIQNSGSWETSIDFFDMDPSGNLMGKLAKRFNLKYGFDGLTFVYRIDKDKVLDTIQISKDNRKIFNFLDLDYDKYLKGFDTVEEIFEYILSSKYMDTSGFQMENLSGIDRKRTVKRKTYQDFLKYVQNRNIIRTFKISKEDALNIVNEYFPEANVLQKIEALKEKERFLKELSEKFNGHIVMELTGLKGKELGNVLSEFKSRYLDFKQFISKNSKEDIIHEFLDFYQN